MPGWLGRFFSRRDTPPPEELFGRSGRWATVRATHLRRQPACIACGRDNDLEVHHVMPYHLDPSLELDDGTDGTDGNLVTVCADPCHLVFGHFFSWKRWNPSVREDCAKFSAGLAAARAAAEKTRGL